MLTYKKHFVVQANKPVVMKYVHLLKNVKEQLYYSDDLLIQVPIVRKSR